MYCRWCVSAGQTVGYILKRLFFFFLKVTFRQPGSTVDKVTDLNTQGLCIEPSDGVVLERDTESLPALRLLARSWLWPLTSKQRGKRGESETGLWRNKGKPGWVFFFLWYLLCFHGLKLQKVLILILIMNDFLWLRNRRLLQRDCCNLSCLLWHSHIFFLFWEMSHPSVKYHSVCQWTSRSLPASRRAHVIV